MLVNFNLFFYAHGHFFNVKSFSVTLVSGELALNHSNGSELKQLQPSLGKSLGIPKATINF